MAEKRAPDLQTCDDCIGILVILRDTLNIVTMLRPTSGMILQEIFLPICDKENKEDMILYSESNQDCFYILQLQTMYFSEEMRTKKELQHKIVV